jgi:hypothetical protein
MGVHGIEMIVNEIITIYDISTPPVPVELMLQRPLANTWDAANPNELSNSSTLRGSRHALRVSVARLLARHICTSLWGTERRLHEIMDDGELLRVFARALLMPRAMLEALSPAVRTPPIIAMRFQVPEDDAQLRLHDLGYLTSSASP